VPDREEIVTLTLNPALDQVCWVDEIEEEVKIRAHGSSFEPGGGGINVARALHQLDVDTTAYWSQGAETGHMMGRLLDEEGVDHHPVDIEATTRVNLAVFADHNGDRELMFNMPGAPLTADEVDRWLHVVDGIDARFVVLSGSRPPDGGPIYGQITRQLTRRSKVILDTSGPGLEQALEEGVFLAKPNREELIALAGRDAATPSGLEAAARDLIETGMAEIVVVSLAGEGALAVTDGGSVRVDAPVVEAKSNVGAGDSMVAGLTRKLSGGFQVEEAVRYGVAAGADAARRPGTELCTRDGVRELLAGTTLHRSLP
jgi:6-phosphofructokinase 2